LLDSFLGSPFLFLVFCGVFLFAHSYLLFFDNFTLLYVPFLLLFGLLSFFLWLKVFF